MPKGVLWAGEAVGRPVTACWLDLRWAHICCILCQHIAAAPGVWRLVYCEPKLGPNQFALLSTRQVTTR